MSEHLLGPHIAPQLLTVSVVSSRHITEHTCDILRIFNTYGAVIVAFGVAEPAREQLLCFKHFFGPTLSHDRADEDMIAEIAVSSEFQGYLGTSNAEHSFHTDGAYDEIAPQVIALRCEIMARTGGITKLASAEAIYRSLIQKDERLAATLFATNALYVERAGRKTHQPVFRRDGNRIMMRYRSDSTSAFSSHPDVKAAMSAIRTFLDNDKNYLSFLLPERHVLLADNTRTLHARTAFPKNEPRKMHRLFFTGTSPLDVKLSFGFTDSKP